MRGIYVDRWRVGTHNEKEIDDLIKFCVSCGMTDLFIHSHEDRAVNDNWDYLGYILKNCGKINIHLWVSLSLGRANDFTVEKVNNISADQIREVTKMVTAKPVEALTTASMAMVTIKDRAEEGQLISLNPTSEKARVYFTDRLSRILNEHPEIYGVHLDKLPDNASQLVSEVRSITKKYLSVPVRFGSSYWKEWEIDEAIPMLVNFSRKQLDDEIIGKFKHIALGCFSSCVERTGENIRAIRKHGAEPILYSYGAYSFRPTETREDFMKAIINAYS